MFFTIVIVLSLNHKACTFGYLPYFPQMAIAAAAFNIVTNVALGAWWAGMVVAISGVLTALNMKSK